MAYQIVMENWAGGMLDSRDVETEEEIKQALLDLVDDVIVAPGDVFRIIDAKP